MNVDGGLGVEVSEDAYSHTSVLALSVDQFKPAADQDLYLNNFTCFRLFAELPCGGI